MSSIAAMGHSSHIKGLVMTFMAVLVLSPDALLVRLIKCDVWTLLFWRCLLTACMQSLFLAGTYREDPATRTMNSALISGEKTAKEVLESAP